MPAYDLSLIDAEILETIDMMLTRYPRVAHIPSIDSILLGGDVVKQTPDQRVYFIVENARVV